MFNKLNLCFFCRLFLLFASSLVFLASVVVMYGWYTKNLFLIQINPSFAMMQFNTALLFFCTSLSFFFMILHLKKVSIFLSLFTFVISFLSVCSHYFGTSFGFESLFFEYNLSVVMENPGRMSLATSVNFSLLSAAIIIIQLNIRSILVVFPMIFSSYVFMFSFSKVFGYFSELRAGYNLVNMPSQAIHTATLFLVLSLFVIFICGFSALKSGLKLVVYPFIISLFVITFTSLMWSVFTVQEDYIFRKISIDRANSLRNLFEFRLEKSINQIEDVFVVDEIKKESSSDYFRGVSNSKFSDVSGLRNVIVFDSNKEIVYRFPADKNEGFSNLENEQLETLKSGSKIYTSFENGNYIGITSFLFEKNDLDFFVYIQLDLVRFFQNISNSLMNKDSACFLNYQNNVIFSEKNKNTDLRKVHYIRLLPQNEGWKIGVALTKDFDFNTFVAVKVLIFLFAIIGTLAGSYLSYVVQKQKEQKQKLEKINELLHDASKRAETANVAKGSFLASVSHEIRTPLNVIVGTLDLMRRVESDEKLLKKLDLMLKSSRSLLALIGDILDFSKIESGSLHMNPEPGSIIELIKSVYISAELKCSKSHLGVFVECPPQPLPNVMIDKLRMEQVLNNLCNNSIKFTKEGYLFIKVIVLNSSPDSLLVRFEVIDTGIGIAPENLSKLFKKFSQIEETISREYGGVGLGLSICSKLVEMQGGKVGVNSEEGKGTTFWVEVPFKLDPNQGPTETYSIQNKRVLLLVESDVLRQILTAYLTAWGVTVDVEDSGQDYNVCITNNPEINRKERVVLLRMGNHDFSESEGASRACLSSPVYPEDLYKIIIEE
jgi:signal transduction histidine kinase